MPPRGRAVSDSLTTENLSTLAASLAAGKRATVYLREANPSLGLPEGTSAKVISIDGNTVTIRPKGVNDELPYEAEELRTSRTPAVPQPPVKRVPVKRPSVTPAPVENRAAPTPAPDAPVTRPVRTQEARRPRKPAGGVSVTIHAGADNDWSVTVTQGAKRPTKARPVSPEAVGRAVRELGDAAARDAVEAVLSHAREEAAHRVAELSRQLEEARTTLAALEQEQ